MVEPGADSPHVARNRLALLLRQLRVDAGLTTEQLAAEVGISQSKISKVENARQRVRLDHVDAWTRACGADEPTSARLIDLAEDALVEASTWRREHRAGLRAKQLRVARLERSATRIQEFQPGIVPGLAQTPDYARAILSHFDVSSQRDVAAAVQTRMDRQQVLYNPDKRVELLIGEIALRWGPAGARHVLAAQLDRLIQLTRTSPLSLGLVPADAATPPQLCGFVIYTLEDDELVAVSETFTGEATYADQRDAAFHSDVFGGLAAAAVFGENARALLTDLLERLHRPGT